MIVKQKLEEMCRCKFYDKFYDKVNIDLKNPIYPLRLYWEGWLSTSYTDIDELSTKLVNNVLNTIRKKLSKRKIRGRRDTEYNIEPLNVSYERCFDIYKVTICYRGIYQ